jgi:hypothetical protein
MSYKQPPVQRPLLISITCSLLYAAGLFGIVYTFTGAYAPYGIFYSAINTLIIVVIFAALSGVWGMERWGVYLFGILVMIKMGIDLYTGAFNKWELLLLVPLVIFTVMFRKMH